jgi:hypothetical protein
MAQIIPADATRDIELNGGDVVQQIYLPLDPVHEKFQELANGLRTKQQRSQALQFTQVKCKA